MGQGKPKTPDYAAATANNPYATAASGKSGSSYSLNPFLTAQNQFVEENLPHLYDQLLNPNLSSPVNQAKSNIFYNQFAADSQKAFENNINALSNRGLMRSSTVNDLSNNLVNAQNNEIANFNNNLIANNAGDTANLINILLNQYLTGANLGQQALGTARADSAQLNNFNQYWWAKQDQPNYSALTNQIASALPSIMTLL